MLFNSIEYAIFLPIVFILYWFVFKKNIRLQNIFLIIVSFIFYAWWDWRFLSLLFILIIVSYFVGLALIHQDSLNKRKTLILFGILVNVGVLGFFKYYNFFVDSFNSAFTLLGTSINLTSLNIILPLGISFYTFKIIGYTIDVYNKKIETEKDFIAYAAFISFFPQLLAGPIERASNLLSQFHKSRIFEYDKAKDGLRQILWGLFKKIVIADNAAVQVNFIFDNYESLNGSTLLLGAIYFAFQIYGDFSGYSDIAIGTGRLFGFYQMKNFAFPYFAKNIKEFWQNWHISLSNWLRDYIFLPLSYSLTRKLINKKYFSLRSDKIVYTFSITVTFLVCGLWHGANWTFIIWGLLFAVYLVFSIYTKNIRASIKKHLFINRMPFISILITFCFSTLGWIFFRADNLTQAYSYINHMFSVSLFSIPKQRDTILLIIILIIIEWIQRKKQHGLEIDSIRLTTMRWVIYYTVILSILNFGASQQQFIYFQF